MVARSSADIGMSRGLAAPDAPARPAPGPEGVEVAASKVRSRASSDFGELYQTHLTYVWKTACRLGVAPADVEDVVQEIFLTAHRRREEFETQANERSWLFAIAYNVVLHHRRSRRRRTAITEGGMNPDVFPDAIGNGPDRSAETNEAVRLLESILDTLDPEKRAVLVLAELEEKSLSEIASILAINVNTAASRLRLGREAVEAAMARHRARDGWRFK